MDISIVICAHNAAGRLRPVLLALSQQLVERDVKWEVILIDNASTDGTGEIAGRWAGEYALELRVFREPKAGLSWARQRGVLEARGEVLSFVDDDNIVAEDWVAKAAHFMRTHPHAGVVGGQIIAEFEDPKTKPADFVSQYAEALGCWDLGTEDVRYPDPVLYPPCGAGLTTRTNLLREIYRYCGSHLTGRQGGRLISGEDYELGLLILRLGWEAWYTPTLRMKHVMPPARLSKDYLRRLRLGNAESDRWLEFLRGREPKRSRLWYLRAWFRHYRARVRIKFLGKMRGSRQADAANYRYWAEEQQMFATGAWRLFTKYPFARVEIGLARLASEEKLNVKTNEPQIQIVASETTEVLSVER